MRKYGEYFYVVLPATSGDAWPAVFYRSQDEAFAAAKAPDRVYQVMLTRRWVMRKVQPTFIPVETWEVL